MLSKNQLVVRKLDVERSRKVTPVIYICKGKCSLVGDYTQKNIHACMSTFTNTHTHSHTHTNALTHAYIDMCTRTHKHTLSLTHAHSHTPKSTKALVL